MNMKTKVSFIVFALGLLISCQQNKSITTGAIKEGMVKVAIFYPNGENKNFDMQYYAQKHMPMAAGLFGDALVAMEIDKGIANGNPEEPLPYVAVGYFYFEDMDAFQKAMGPNSATLRDDVPNYTNIKPILQISKVQTAR
jgi:uncharacterized protein (TIGR02118 family)